MRAYLDASVLGGYFDLQFEESSRSPVQQIRLGEIKPIVSDMLIAEITRAPQPVQDLLAEILEGNAEQQPATQQSPELQEAYLQAGVVGQKHADGALHVAEATLAQADVLVSWNFRHLVNPARVRTFNEVNLMRGHGLVVILTPTDVVRLVEEENEEADR